MNKNHRQRFCDPPIMNKISNVEKDVHKYLKGKGGYPLGTPLFECERNPESYLKHHANKSCYIQIHFGL